jgi:hypothetical protein
MIDSKTKKRFEPILAEFRRGIALHRAEGATEERIRQILGASIWLTIHEVEDPEVRAWLCEEFNKAARLAPIITNYPGSSTIH